MKREQAIQLAEDALNDLHSALEQGCSESMIRYLDTMAKFHRYSYNNCLMIAFQKPDATMVAGFRRWQQLGRQVRKGQKGIAILAPLIGKKKNDDDEDEKSLYGFRVVHVFDVSQTEGDELPELATIAGDAGDQLTRLEQVTASYNIPLEYANIPGLADGYSTEGSIIVEQSLCPTERFAVLAHELAHELLHTGKRRKEASRTIKETEAEAVAYVVCRAAGLDCSTRSSDYILSHSGDVKTLQQSLDSIQKVAARIIADLESVQLVKSRVVA